MNIADARIPFTGVIETTTFIDPRYVGGHHLVYLPKYTAPNSEWLQLSDDAVRERVFATLKLVNPSFDTSWVRQLLIHRERYVEPLRRIGDPDPAPAVESPVENLYVATTAQIYPALTNGESVSRHARDVADIVARRVATQAESHAFNNRSAIAV